MSHEDIRRRGFKDRTRLEEARAKLADRIDPHGRTADVGLVDAVGRVTARPIIAKRDVPHYNRAAMDGWAVKAADTHGASDRSPNRLVEANAVRPGKAMAVNTGEALPAGADAVVMKEQVTNNDGDLDIFTSVAVGSNVGQRGEDVSRGTELVGRGVRLRPTDVGIAKATGSQSITCVDRSRIAVIPTGDELVQREPEPGEIVETNGLTVRHLVSRWGGKPSYRGIVPDDIESLKAAIERDLDHDLIVTTGGSSVGERDLIPELVDELGEVFVHGVALKPGHPVALGAVSDTPIMMLPGYPVACVVNAMQFLRPATSWAMGAKPYPIPTTSAVLEGKIRSEAGHRTFARVGLEKSQDGTQATPVRASGAGILSSITEADGWVVVPEAREGIPAGETVTVERWEWPP